MVELETRNGYPLWHYLPSPVASGIFITLFATMLALYTWRMFKNYNRIAIPFIIGILCEFLLYNDQLFAKLSSRSIPQNL